MAYGPKSAAAAVRRPRGPCRFVAPSRGQGARGPGGGLSLGDAESHGTAQGAREQQQKTAAKITGHERGRGGEISVCVAPLRASMSSPRASALAAREGASARGSCSRTPRGGRGAQAAVVPPQL